MTWVFVYLKNLQCLMRCSIKFEKFCSIMEVKIICHIILVYSIRKVRSLELPKLETTKGLYKIRNIRHLGYNEISVTQSIVMGVLPPSVRSRVSTSLSLSSIARRPPLARTCRSLLASIIEFSYIINKKNGTFRVEHQI